MALLTSLFIISGCGTSNNDPEETATEDPINVTMTMENGGEVVMELYPDIAPKTVENFVSLARDSFYDGLTFHRIIPGFMIQGGDPDGTGMGGPDHSIEGEFSSNGFENDLKHDRGVLSMARSQDPDSAGSQFFIVVEDSPHLDGDYAAFGKVTEGMDVVDEIVAVETDDQSKPLEGQEQIIQSITVE
ncbi:peptidylprolyl isomerase [Alkalicoccobacillus plakortidis]|uniref:Peptidyl-prolyl cis-trans isomerase n=1 Tax=Alkalicoccobacillus plakortidis TaxID=444060 RepID=A0ABT0XMQ6_9BACI|nr:peptidylprolyl isomerase [Alkalicoccobacillus plakortidis]MCM2677193.1 peptidylprolyl isomerase [Alkalicoccobacillus plakortidis]